MGAAYLCLNLAQAIGVYYMMYLGKFEPDQIDISKFFTVYFSIILGAESLGNVIGLMSN